jgi:hypothetical protein
LFCTARLVCVLAAGAARAAACGRQRKLLGSKNELWQDCAGRGPPSVGGSAKGFTQTVFSRRPALGPPTSTRYGQSPHNQLCFKRFSELGGTGAAASCEAFMRAICSLNENPKGLVLLHERNTLHPVPPKYL